MAAGVKVLLHLSFSQRRVGEVPVIRKDFVAAMARWEKMYQLRNCAPITASQLDCV